VSSDSTPNSSRKEPASAMVTMEETCCGFPSLRLMRDTGMPVGVWNAGRKRLAKSTALARRLPS